MPILAALGTVLAGFIAGVILIAGDHVIIGMAVAFASIPMALGVWIKVSDRM